jgi:hypothetical protein
MRKLLYGRSAAKQRRRPRIMEPPSAREGEGEGEGQRLSPWRRGSTTHHRCSRAGPLHAPNPFHSSKFVSCLILADLMHAHSDLAGVDRGRHYNWLCGENMSWFVFTWRRWCIRCLCLPASASLHQALCRLAHVSERDLPGRRGWWCWW